MRTHMDVKEGYRPLRPTVKASDARGGPGGRPAWPGRQIAGPPEGCSVERYAPGMGYPGDEGGGPPDSRLDARTRRAAVSSPPRAIPPGWQAPDEEEPGETSGRRRAPAAGSAGPSRTPQGSAGAARPSQAMGAGPGTAGKPATRADPAAATGARTLPPTREHQRGYAAPARTTGYRERSHRGPGLSSLARPGTGYPRSTGLGRRGPGRGPGRRRREPAESSDAGHGAIRPAQPRPRPAAVLPHGRTPGGGRSGGPATRSRARPGTVRQRRNTVPRVTVEHGRVPDRGARRTRAGPGLPARIRSA